MKRLILVLTGVVLVMTAVSCNSKVKISEDRRTDNIGKVVVVKEKDEEIVELFAVIRGIAETSLKVETSNGDLYIVHLDENLIFHDNIDKNFEIGNLLIIGYSGEVIESDPNQINAISIISNEKDEKIKPDPKESISGYIGEKTNTCKIYFIRKTFD